MSNATAPTAPVTAIKFNAQNELLNIAVSPSSVDELIQFLVLAIPWCCCLYEMFKRMTPSYRNTRASIRAERVSRRSARQAAEVEEGGDVVRKQRAKDDAEEEAIKKRAAAQKR